MRIYVNNLGERPISNRAYNKLLRKFSVKKTKEHGVCHWNAESGTYIRWRCTLVKGHTGPHIAHSISRGQLQVCAVFTDNFGHEEKR